MAENLKYDYPYYGEAYHAPSAGATPLVKSEIIEFAQALYNLQRLLLFL